MASRNLIKLQKQGQKIPVLCFVCKVEHSFLEALETLSCQSNHICLLDMSICSMLFVFVRTHGSFVSSCLLEIGSWVKSRRNHNIT